MSAPSALHEDRVDALRALADLAGFTTAVKLGVGVLPDLSRVHRSMPRLLVGDAKATEDPSDGATRRRLGRYALWSQTWSASGFEVHVAVAHGADPDCSWQRCLASIVALSGQRVVSSRVVAVDGDLWVSTARLGEGPVGLSRPMPIYPLSREPANVRMVRSVCADRLAWSSP